MGGRRYIMSLSFPRTEPITGGTQRSGRSKAKTQSLLLTRKVFGEGGLALRASVLAGGLVQIPFPCHPALAAWVRAEQARAWLERSGGDWVCAPCRHGDLKGRAKGADAGTPSWVCRVESHSPFPGSGNVTLRVLPPHKTMGSGD